MAIRTGAAAVRYALSVTSGYSGMCLKFVRTCFNVAARYPSARSAWRNAKYRHWGGDGRIPAGVPVYWDYYPNGHVAISIGGVGTDGSSRIRSTDWPYKGQVRNTTVKALSRRWGKRYTGWAEDINGVRVYRPTTATTTRPTVDLSVVVAAAKAGGRTAVSGVSTIQRALNKEFPSSTQLVVDGKYGPATKSRYASWQKRLGYSGSAADGIPGWTSLNKLGNKYNFRVVA